MKSTFKYPKTAALLLLLILIAFLTSCAYYSKVTSFTGAENYHKAMHDGIIEGIVTFRSGYVPGMPMKSFPSDIDQSEIKEFFIYKYDVVIGRPGYQAFLLASYDKEKYELEKTRIKVSGALDMTEYTGTVTYALLWNCDHRYEYVMFFDDGTVAYVFTQLLSEDDVKIDKKYYYTDADITSGIRFAIDVYERFDTVTELPQ